MEILHRNGRLVCIIPNVPEGSNTAWSEPTNQSSGNVRQPIGRWTVETKPGRAVLVRSRALSSGTPLPVFGQREATHRWKIHTSTQNLLRLWRRSNLKTIRLVYNYFQEKEWMFFPPSAQTIVSLCPFGNKNKTSWTALSATVQTCILLCHQ